MPTESGPSGASSTGSFKRSGINPTPDDPGAGFATGGGRRGWVERGGQDVPTEKLIARFPRTLANLAAAIRALPHVWIFDNDDLRAPFRQVAVFEMGRPVRLNPPVPGWLQPLFRPA